MELVTNIVAAAAVGMSSSCAGLPNKEVSADEEKAFQTLVKFCDMIHYEDQEAVCESAFRQVGRDGERMTRVLIRLAQEAIARFKGIDGHWPSRDLIECDIDLWRSVAQRSIGGLGEYGTKTAIPFLEAVLTNDICGASERAMNAYVKLGWDDGRAFDFIRRHFGEGRKLSLEMGRTIYWTLKDKLADKGLPEAMRKGYIDYLLKRAECETSSVNGPVLDGILVEHVPGYRDSEKRKANLKAIKWPDPNFPQFHFRRRQPPPGLSSAEVKEWHRREDSRFHEEGRRYDEAVKKYKEAKEQAEKE